MSDEFDENGEGLQILLWAQQYAFFTPIGKNSCRKVRQD
jgi:hypothetical protein